MNQMCCVCDKFISYYNFNTHLKLKHNLTLFEYITKFRDNINLYYIFKNEKYLYDRKELTCLNCGENFKFHLKSDYKDIIINLNCKCSHQNNKKKLDCFFEKEHKTNIEITNKIKHVNSVKNSLEKYIEKYGIEEGTNRYKNKNSRTAGTLENFIKRHGIKDGIEKFEVFCEKSKQTKENFIKRHGEELGKIKWNEHQQIKLDTSKRCLNYWLIVTNYDIERSKKLYAEYQDFGSKKYFIRTYGRKIGLIKYKDVSQSKGLSLENQISKHGLEEGTNRYNKFIEAKQGIGNLDYYIEKYGKIKGTKKYLEITKKRISHNLSYSKISQELFWLIYKELPTKLKDKCYFAELNSEYFIITEDYHYKFFDFVIPEINLCIEFNGDIFHANPEKFKENDKPNPYNNLTSKEIWEYDKIKNNLLLNKGIEVHVIWEKDYRKNKEKIINYILNVIKENYELYYRQN